MIKQAKGCVDRGDSQDLESLQNPGGGNFQQFFPSCSFSQVLSLGYPNTRYMVQNAIFHFISSNFTIG